MTCWAAVRWHLGGQVSGMAWSPADQRPVLFRTLPPVAGWHWLSVADKETPANGGGRLNLLTLLLATLD
jgi:hypothetical protein